MDEADDDQRGHAVEAVGQRRPIDASRLHLLAGGTEPVPGGRDFADARLLHEVLAHPQHVGRGIADAGAAVLAVSGFVDVVGARIVLVRTDRLDHVAERLDQPLRVVRLHRKGGQMRDHVRLLLGGEGRRELRRVAFVRGRLEHHLHPRMSGFEGRDLFLVRSELAGRGLRRPPAERDVVGSGAPRVGEIEPGCRHGRAGSLENAAARDSLAVGPGSLPVDFFGHLRFPRLFRC
jgi:hypothetical protein